MTTPVPEPTLGEAAYRLLLASEVTELDEIEHGKVRCTIVTPERAVLDAVCDMVILPLFDGELGVLAGRAPFVGQLGPGELRLKTGNAVARFFVDGGFAQVRGNLVNVLTQKAIPAKDVTAEKADAARAEADALAATDEVTRTNRNRALERARGMAKVAAKNPV
jgi:F-type H+-transporting ATPase subunit epsilon